MKQFKNNYSEAFTFIETVVSLVIISIICVLLSFCYSSSIKNLSKTKNSSKNSIEILEFDSTLRKTINKISMPEWENVYETTFSQSSILLPWVNGIEEPLEINTPKNINIQKTETLFYSNNKPAGLTITYLVNNQNYECSCLFSSIPYGAVKL